MDEEAAPVARDPNVAGWGANLDVAMGRKRILAPKGDSRRDKWIRWLSAIDDDLKALAINRMAWRALTAVWREREPQLPASFIFDFFATTYAHAQASGIRRQVDTRDDLTSLLRLLKEIERNPERLHRNWLVGRYDWGDQWRGEREFAALDPDGLGHVDPEEALRDLDRLVKVADGIRTWVNRHVAHLSTTPSPVVPTFAELDGALDAMAAVFSKWNCILTGIDLVSIEPVPQYDFLAPLRVPWLLDSNS